MDFKEEDLYVPVAAYLTELGYTVKGEIKNLDILAVKDGEMLAVELKKQFNLKLVYQAIDRQTVCSKVYVAIPRPPKGLKDSGYKNMIKLLKRLDIGLITVSLDSVVSRVDVHLLPQETVKKIRAKKKKGIAMEFEGRSGDYNKGGVTHTKIVTAYREKALALACAMESVEEITLEQLRKMGFESAIASILGKNYYGWFQRKKRGVYTLSSMGKEALNTKEYAEIVTHFRKLYH